jgi:hypothetical protein
MWLTTKMTQRYGPVVQAAVDAGVTPVCEAVIAPGAGKIEAYVRLPIQSSCSGELAESLVAAAELYLAADAWAVPALAAGTSTCLVLKGGVAYDDHHGGGAGHR